jgi:TP901 family phage tail tape measure protein
VGRWGNLGTVATGSGMAVETELIVRIASGGAGQTVRDVVGVQKAIAQLSKDTKDANTLARELGKAFNLPDNQVQDLAKALKQARGEAEGFSKVSGKLNLSDALGVSSEAAQEFANKLGLTTEEALAALAVISELNQGNVSAADQYELLNEQLGVTQGQFDALSQAAAQSQGRLAQIFSGGVQGEVAGLNNKFSFLLKTILAFGAAATAFKLIDNALKATGKTWIDVAAAIGFNRSQLEGLIVDFKSGNTSIQKGLQGINSRAQAFVQSLKNVGSSLKSFTGQALFGGKSGLAGFAELIERLSKGFSIFTAGKLLLGGFGKEVEATGQKTARFSGLLQGLAAGASFAVINALTDAFRRLGMAITDTLTSAVQSVSDFEGSKAAAATLTDDVDGLVTALEGAQKRLGGQVTTAELVASSYDILSSGFTNAADAATIAEQSARGAIAGFSDAETVADALTTVLNAYGKSSADATQIVDQLVATQNLGKITIDQYAQSLGRGASIAASAGVSFEEFSAAVAAATAAGVPAESAVSGVRQSIVNLLKPTNQAKDLLAEFGINNVQATLASEGLVGVLQRLADQDATSAQLSTIFSDVDALTAIAPIAGENVGKLRDALAQIEGSTGSADKAIAKITNSLPGLRKQLDTTAKEGILAFGQALEPAVVGLIRLTDEVLNAVDGAALFAPLILAGEALAAAFERNSQLVGTLADALTTLASTAINAVAGAITQLATYIESTPGSFNRFGESLAQVADIASEMAAIFGGIALAVGGETLDAFQDLLPAIALAADVLGGIASAIKVLVVDTGLLNVVLKVLILRFLAVQAIALGQFLLGIGGAMGVLAAATKVATVAMSAFGISTTAVLGPLALLAAGVAAVTFVRFTKELKDANDALDSYILGLDASTGQGFEFANKLNNLNDAIAAKGGKATAEQLKQLTEYTRLSKEQVTALQQQLSEVQAFDPQNESQRQSQQNLIQQLNTTINALSGQITDAEGTLASAATATGKGGGAALADGFEAAADLRPVLDDLVQANKEALDKIELDALNAEAAILAGGGAQEKLAANEKVALEKRIKENKRFLDQLKAQQGNLADTEGGSADATQQIAELEKQLAQDRVSLARTTLEEQKRADEERVKSAEAAAKKQTDALKAQRDKEKELAEGQNTARTKNENKAFAENERNRQKDFAKSERELDKANQEELEALQEESQNRIQAKQKAFDQQQQAAAEAFQNRQNAERDTGNREFDALGSEVDKRLQLAQAEGDQRAELIKQFAEERKTLELRRQIEKEVLAQRGSVLAAEDITLSPLEQARADFEARLQAEAAAFQVAQNTEKEAFEIGLAEQRKLDEAAIGQVREDQEEARRKRQEQFDDDQRDRQEAFEARQEQREAKFRTEQRRLDEESAKRIEQILAAAKPKGQSLRSGGVAEGGMVQVHKDEFLLPPKGTRVVSQRESRELVREALSARQTAALMRGQVLPVGRGLSVPSVGGQGEVVAKLDQVLKAIKDRPPVRPQATYHLSTPTPQADAVGMQLEEIRGLVRMGRL